MGALRTTLFYWFNGVPEDRPGGPWWHRKFKNYDELVHYLTDMSPFLQAWCRVHDHDGCGGDDCAYMFPPKDAEIESNRDHGDRYHLRRSRDRQGQLGQ